MIPDAPMLLGASTNPARHAELATPEGVRARLAALQLNAATLDALARNEGTVLRAHLFDAYAARVWIREALRGSGETIDGFLASDPDQQRAEVIRVWRAFANFWRALNVNPYAWMPLRHAFEDAWGHPRSAAERGPSVTAEENALHLQGVTWRFQELREGFGAETVYQTTSNDPGLPPGATRVAWEGWFRARLREAHLRVGGADLGDRRIVWGWTRRRYGEGGGGLSLHRLRLAWNASSPADAWVHPVMSTPAQTWNADALFDPGSPIFELNVPGAARGWSDDFRVIVDDDGIAYALPASRWYFDLLRAPRPGLRVREGGPDLSLVEYLDARGPEEVLREVMRDVMVLNLAAMDANQLTREDQLFTEAARREFATNHETRTQDLADVQRSRNTASAVLDAATGIAAAANPIAGVIVGAAALIGRLGLMTLRPAEDSTARVDVFGRPMPTFEQFEATGSRSVLEGHLRAVGLPPGAPVDPEADRAARELRAREATRRIDAVREAFGAQGALLALFVGAQRAAGRRSVMLTGLDPVHGARVFIGDREYTTGLPELGRARWVDARGTPAWFFGVPESAASLRVVYPDGRSRTLELPAITPQVDSDDSPETRMAVLDATPPAADAVDAETALGFPSRTVVLVGLSQATPPRIDAEGIDVSASPAPTGDAARWIDSTLVPGVPGYLFGVPAGARSVTAADAQGARTFPLPAISLTADVRDRVTVIDARRPATATTLPGVVKVGLAGTLAYGLYRLLRRTP